MQGSKLLAPHESTALAMAALDPFLSCRLLYLRCLQPFQYARYYAGRLHCFIGDHFTLLPPLQRATAAMSKLSHGLSTCPPTS